MRIPGLKQARLFYRWLHGQWSGQALILGYHRITAYEHDPFNICVSPQHFAEQLIILRQLAQPIPLMTLVTGMREGNLPKRAVVVTLDDGYADTLYEAVPLLEKHQIPATVFVTTGYQGGQFWWDILARILTVPNLSPNYELTLPHSMKIETEQLTLAARKELLWQLYDYLLPLPAEEREVVMEQMQAWLGEDDGQGGRPLTPSELRQVATNELITIGGHTVTHPMLATLTVSQQEFEIRQCKKDLEETIGGDSIQAFSYPNGSLTATTRSLVQTVGYHCACASQPDLIYQNSDPFHLPRFWIPDWDGVQFSRWLQRWLPH